MTLEAELARTAMLGALELHRDDLLARTNPDVLKARRKHRGLPVDVLEERTAIRDAYELVRREIEALPDDKARGWPWRSRFQAAMVGA